LKSTFSHKSKEIKDNDIYKEKLANDNNITNYIIIDARKSDLKLIKNNVLNSPLKNYYDLSDIDWELCDKQSCKSYMKEICGLWNLGNTNIDLLATQYHLCTDTITNYLSKGNKLNWCIYDKQINYLNGRQKGLQKFDNRKPVICITTNERFNSQTEATEYYHLYKTGVNDCCCGRIASAGKHPITGEKLVWKYA